MEEKHHTIENQQASTKEANQNSKLFEFSRSSIGDSVPSLEAKQSREKAEDAYEKEQMNQEASFCKTIMEGRV